MLIYLLIYSINVCARQTDSKLPAGEGKGREGCLRPSLAGSFKGRCSLCTRRQTRPRTIAFTARVLTVVQDAHSISYLTDLSCSTYMVTTPICKRPSKPGPAIRNHSLVLWWRPPLRNGCGTSLGTKTKSPLGESRDWRCVVPFGTATSLF